MSDTNEESEKANPVHPPNWFFTLPTYNRNPTIGIFSNYPIFAARKGYFWISYVSKKPNIGLFSNYQNCSRSDGLD